MQKINYLRMGIVRSLLPIACLLAASLAWAQAPAPVAVSVATNKSSPEKTITSTPSGNAGESLIPLGAPGSIAERVAACTMCHGATDVQGADAFYPAISGKPAQYLYQQLLRFREGSREYLPMQRLLANLSDDYLHDIATWFSEQTPQYKHAPPATVPASILAMGEKLALQGAPERQIPACVACHGENLKGMQAAIPGLTGLTNEYITAQMGAWQYGIRHSVAPDCMRDIANKLTSAEVQAVAAWLASQDPNTAGHINMPTKLPLECGIQTISGVQP